MKQIQFLLAIFLAGAVAFGQQQTIQLVRASWDTTAAADVQRVVIMNPGSVPPSVKLFKNLRELSLFGNDWDDNLRNLPAEVCSLQKLRSFYLANTNVDALPAKLWKLPALEVLEISSNKICTLPPVTGNMPPLKVLSIDQQIDSVPTLPYLQKLTYFIYQPKQGYRFSGLGTNKSLRQVSVLGTGTNYEILDELLQEVVKIHGLTSLDLGDMIPGEQHLNTISGMPSLKTLSFSVFSVSPDALALFTRLDTLTIRSIATINPQERKQVFEELFSMGLNELVLNYQADDLEHYRLQQHLTLQLQPGQVLSPKEMEGLASLDGLTGLVFREGTIVPSGMPALIRLRTLDISRVIPNTETISLADAMIIGIGKMPLLTSVRIHADWFIDNPLRIKLLNHLQRVTIVGAPEPETPDSPEMIFRKTLLSNCPSVLFQPY